MTVPVPVRSGASALAAALALLIGCSVAGADEPASEEAAREALSLLLTTKAGDQPTSDAGPCTQAGPARTVRDDVIYFLGQLSRDGQVNGTCGARDGKRACELRIGQAEPDSENVWSRTYDVVVDPATQSPAEPVACFSVP